MTHNFSQIAIVGAPNAGKSTLTNRLVGEKISIVTPKPQTTRTRITGILTQGSTQLVFMDTPGIFGAQGNFEKRMVQDAYGSLEEADVIMLVVDASKVNIGAGDAIIPAKLRGNLKGSLPILVLNKIDKIQKHKLLEIIAVLNSGGDFKETFMISAENGDGVDDLKARLFQLAAPGEWRFPEDCPTDMPLKLLVAEIMREKLFMNLNQEVPYGLHVETESWQENDEGVIIHMAIIVEREGQKKIVIGKGGSVLKEVGTQARREIKSWLGGRPVNLQTFVKVRENWKDRIGRN
jgi:GTP-binding protein Era